MAQVSGAFLAGLITYAFYQDAIISFDTPGGQTAAAGGSAQALGVFAGGSGKAFFTQPASFPGVGVGFANEFVATAILACAILALGDDQNAQPGAGMHALIVGLVVTALAMAFGYNTGACMNPARDFGPRVATAAVGYGSEAFALSDAWWVYGAWGAISSDALIGGFFYDVAIFVGGESPVNYPRSRRRRVKEEAKKMWFVLKREAEKGVVWEFGKNG
jgi:aquaglyceroporin related protein